MISRRVVLALSLTLSSGACADDRGTAQPATVSVISQPMTQPAKAEAKTEVKEKWYILQLQGQRAGWLRSTTTTKDGIITSASETSLELKREMLKIRVNMQTEFVETAEGKPLRLSTTQKLGAMATTKRITFNDDGTMTVVNTQPTPTGKPIENTQTLPKPDKAWLTPAAAERMVEAELAKGSKEIVITTLDPSLGESPVTVTRTILERTTTEAFGKVVPAVKWKSSVDTMKSAEVVEYVGDDGETIRSEVNLGGLSLVQLLADKDLAMSKLDAPELLASTLVKVEKPIANPRQTMLATYTVTSSAGNLPDLPSVAGQTFERTNATSGNVTVRAGAAGHEPVAPDVLASVKAEHLKSSSMMNLDDAEVIKLAEKIDIKGLDEPAAAEKIRRFVHAFITAKDMSVGFATASEVCRTRTGDCTEHGVLLAALLRAKGIPARVASGLIYVDEFAGQTGVFGYHMWSQALIDGAWQNLDATLPDATPYDAAHITLSTSSLNEGQVQNFLVTTAPLIGRLKIAVTSTK